MKKAEKFARQLENMFEESSDVSDILEEVQHEAVISEEYEDFVEYQFRDSSILTVGNNNVVDFVN